MKLRRLRGIIAAPIVLGLVLLLEQFGYAKQVRIFTPLLFGMERVSADLWVDEKMSPGQRRDLAVALAEARRKVQAFWGVRVGTPTVCACASAECYRRFGFGRDRGHEFGGRVILSPRGLDSVVIAHEWTHTETATRAGFFARIPSWFTEGMAVLVSADPRYSEEQWTAATQNGRHAPRLGELESLRSFIDAPHAYLVAGHELRRWYSKVGGAGLEDLLSAVRNGEEFERAYRRIEARELAANSAQIGAAAGAASR